ncbi:MAG TPA: serine/threonine-protein kinase [Nannocystaceae bacterium]|nr:serine/threonine-protein kinase [Nannocystaceae bacterium]
MVDPTSAARASGLPPGTRMGRYTLLRRFAIGGMAELYLAHQRGAEGFVKLVALKRILPHLAADPQFTRMFLDEARLAAALDHLNIAHVLDFGECDGEHFLTMEYVHGRHLLDVLRAHKGRGLPLPTALAIVAAVGRALHHVHELRGHDGRPMGLVHRDVSPSNVLISYEGAVKLTDFGIAKAMELTSFTRTGTFKGKLGYAAPEQCRGEAIDRRADVYALGIVLYETTLGVRAYSGPNEFAVLGKVARGDYVAPQVIDPEYPAELAAIIARAMAPLPEDRYQTAAELADAIDELSYALDLRGASTAVSTLMHASFGEPPPVTTNAELSVVGAVVPTRTGATGVSGRRGRALPVLAGAGVIGLVVGAWAFGRAGATPSAASVPVQPSSPAATSKPVVEPPTAAPVVVPAPVVVAPVAAVPTTTTSIEPPPRSVATPERKPARDKRRTRRHETPRKHVEEDAGLGDLYPPGHPR